MSGLLNKKESANAIWLIGGKICQMLLSLVVSILTARYLGPANFGLVSYGTTFVSFFMAFCTLGINSVIIKDFFDHPDDCGVAIGSSILLRSVSSFLSALMIVGIVSILDYGETETILVVALCSISLVFHAADTINYWFQYQYKSKVTAIVTFVAYFVTSLYKIVLLILQKDVRWFALASSVDYIVISLLLFFAYQKYHGPKLRFSLEKAKSILGKSYHYILSTMMIAIYAQTDKLMLKQFLGEAEVGYYATAVSICSIWTFVLQAIIDSLHPSILQLHSVDKEAFDRKNRQLYAIIFYVSCFVSIGFLLLGDWGILLLYGEDYAPAGLPLKIITWYTAFSYLGVARNSWLVSNEKQRYLKYIYFGAALINVILNCVFIPIMGTAGAALASLITQMFTSIILPYFFKEIRPNAKLMIEAILLKDIIKKKD